MTDERSGNRCFGTAERQLGGAAACSVQLSLSLPCVIPQHPDLPETSPAVRGLSLELLPGLTEETHPCSPEHTEPWAAKHSLNRHLSFFFNTWIHQESHRELSGSWVGEQCFRELRIEISLPRKNSLAWSETALPVIYLAATKSK